MHSISAGCSITCSAAHGVLECHKNAGPSHAHISGRLSVCRFNCRQLADRPATDVHRSPTCCTQGKTTFTPFPLPSHRRPGAAAAAHWPRVPPPQVRHRGPLPHLAAGPGCGCPAAAQVRPFNVLFTLSDEAGGLAARSGPVFTCMLCSPLAPAPCVLLLLSMLCCHPQHQYTRLAANQRMLAP